MKREYFISDRHLAAGNHEEYFTRKARIANMSLPPFLVDHVYHILVHVSRIFVI
jgi:hypothetical protein